MINSAQQLIVRLTFYVKIVSMALMICVFTSNVSALDELIDFQISPQSVETAMLVFSDQTGIQVVMPSIDVRDIESVGISGKYTIVEALATLLRSTGLEFEMLSTETVVVRTRSETIVNESTQPRSIIDKLTVTDQGSSVNEESSMAFEIYSHSKIEEIVITAQKREQNLQDIGIAVTNFSAAEMRELGIHKAEDLAGQTPGLDIKNALGALNPVFTLRGIGLNDYNINNNPSVGAYVDEVYMASSAYLAFQMFDLERVEVLKGPQGTLYGRNTTGGAINFITTKPTEAFEAYVDVKFGRWNTIEVEGAINGALGENLSGRLAFSTNHSDGYYKNNGTIGSSAGFTAMPGIIPPVPAIPAKDDFVKQENYSVRGTLAWTPGKSADVLASFHYSKDNSDNLSRSMDQGSTDLSFILNPPGFSPSDNDPFTVDSNLDPENNIEAYGGVLKSTWDMGFATLVSVTGYEAIDRVISFDDSSPFRIVDQNFVEDMWEISQEFRLSSNSDRSVYWLVGVFYSYENLESLKQVSGLDFITLTSIFTEYEQTGDSYAIFGQVEYQVMDNINLTGGLRYTYDDKAYKGGSATDDPFGVDQCAVFFNCPQSASNDFDEDSISGKIAVDWILRDDLLLYASWNKGFKSGGFDGSTITDPSAFKPFFGETLYAYEIGMKSTWFNNTLQWNTSAFKYDYQDMQAERESLVIAGPNPVFESVRSNVGEARIWGLETEVWWKPSYRWNVKLGLALLDTEIVEWISDDPADVTAHVGNKIPDAPEVTFNGLVRYERPVSDSLMGTVMMDFNWVDNTFKNIDNDSYLAENAYWLVNGRISISSVGKTWEVTFLAKNIFNKLYFRQRFDNFGPGWIYETPGAPLSYGINFRYNWR